MPEASSTGNWLEALRIFLPYLSRIDVEWMLVGSAATAIHGVEIIPGDIDFIFRTPEGVAQLADVACCFAQKRMNTQDASVFLSSEEQPLLVFAEGNWTFGRWLVDGTRVEVACIKEPGKENSLAETYGNQVWIRKETIVWQSECIPIVPLEVQLATMLFRRYESRIMPTVARMSQRGFDPELLVCAFKDRGIELEDITDLTQ